MYILLAYTILGCGFEFYQIYLTTRKGTNWQFVDTEQIEMYRTRHLVVKSLSLLQYPLAGCCLYLGKRKHGLFYDLIVHILIVTLCVKYGVEH